MYIDFDTSCVIEIIVTCIIKYLLHANISLQKDNGIQVRLGHNSQKSFENN